MAKGHLSEDTINFIMTAESSQLQQEIHKTGKVIDDLKKKEVELRKDQVAIKSVLGEESKEYKDLSIKIKKVTQEIADESLKLTELHKRFGTSSMTMAQLRKEAKQLQRQLDNTSQSLNPQEYEAYASKLREVQQRMEELKNTAKGLSAQGDSGGFFSKLFGSKIDFTQLKTFLTGNAIAKFGEIAIETIGKVASRIKDLVTESVEAARAAEGITHAFDRLNQPGLLDNLRKATHGTVSDLELMKAAVQAQDFRLPLDQLGKYLEFAQTKARDTGQSVDYLVSSIVTGLGRNSLPILDNLGLSAAQIKEEMAKTGDMAIAVGNIIDQQLSEQGEHYETAAEREEKATTDVTNAQLELGRQMRKTFGIGSTSFKEMQSKAEAFILKGLTKLIIYCQDLYNKLGYIRVSVELVKFTFDTLFKLCEVGFKFIIDAIKGVARVSRDFNGILEGMFTFNFDKATNAFKALMVDIGKTVKDFIKDGKDVGSRWGNNVLENINAVLGKGKIDSPNGDNTLDDLVVTGKRKPKRDKPDNSPSTTARDTADDDLKHYQQNLEKLSVGGMSDAEKREHDLQQQLLLLKGYYDASMAYAKQHGEDTEAIDAAYLKAREKIYQDYLAREAQMQQQQTDKEARQREQQEQQAERQRQRELTEQQQQEQRKQQIRQQYGLVGQQEFYQMQLDQLRQYYDQELLTTEEYEEAKKQLRMQNLKESFDYWQNQVSSAVSALQDAELAQVESKYDAEIAAAMKAGKDTSKLEEQKEAEKLNIQKKYADVNFAVKCSEIIANTAVAIMKALSELGPIAGPVAAALMGVTGAAQLMVAKAERDRIKNMTVGSGSSSSGTVSAARVATGLEGGGYLDVEREQDGKRYHAKYDPNRRGYVSRPTVIVGEGPAGQSKEWVASNAAVENPTVRPIIDAIDAAQRAGNIRTLDLNKVLLQRGLQSGGSIAVAPSVTTPGASVSGYSRTLARLVEILDRMEQNGIPALVGIDQIEAEQKLRDQARKIGSKHEDH